MTKNKGGEEIWRPMVGYEDRYAISNEGRVKIIQSHQKTYIGRILKCTLTPKGYPKANISKNDKKKSIEIHILVAAAFLGSRPKDHTINHKNGIKTDNRPENLEYVTRRQNQQHALNELGFQPRFGENHPHAKWTNEEVSEMRRLYKSGVTQAELCVRFGAASNTICNIVNYKIRVVETRRAIA